MRIIVIFFVTVLLQLELSAATKTKVFILHSYSQEYPWTKKQHNGFIKTLSSESTSFELYTEYLDTKRVAFTPEYQKHFLKYLNYKYRDGSVDMVYVTDDNALSFIVNNYDDLFNEMKIPVFFSGINDLTQQRLDPSIYKGVFEVKEIKPNLELIRQLSPQTDEIWFAGDDSSTYKAIQKEIKQLEPEFQKFTFHYLSNSSIDQVQQKLPTKPRSFVILTTIGAFKDATNQTLLPHESIQRLKQPNILLFSMEDAYVNSGVIGGYVTSGDAQGVHAAKLLLEYLQTNDLTTISSITKSPNLYLFNSTELTNSRIYLSQYILHNATIIGQDKAFIEKNQSLIISLLFWSLSALILLFLALYFIKQKAYKKLQKQFQRREDIKQRLIYKHKTLQNVLNLGSVAHWKYDPESKHYVVSDLLQQMFGIRNSTFYSVDDFFHYLVTKEQHPLLNDTIKEVLTSKKSQTITHEIIDMHNHRTKVLHTIYIDYDFSLQKERIAGVLTVEN